MTDYEPIELRAFFRANHSTVWELADKAGILAQLGMTLKSLDPCISSNLAEEALLTGKVDFVSGNHITPYWLVAQGKPIVCLASPSNSVRDRLVVRQSLGSVTELREAFRGKTLRVADSNLLDDFGGYWHPVGNHILDLREAGFADEGVERLEVASPQDPGLRKAVMDALMEGRADVAFAGYGAEELSEAGFHTLQLDTLPMVNGPTITTSYESLNKKDRLGDRLVKAMIMTIHYACLHPEEAQRLLDIRLGRPYEERGGRAMGAVASRPMKPYPASQAVANAHELCRLRFPGTEAMSPLALWDIHYLRDLDLCGFIDELIGEQPERDWREGRGAASGD